MMGTAVKWLRIVPILFLAIFLTSQSARAHDVYKSIDNPEAKAFGNRVCTNKDCVKLAAMLIHDRNDKISPCEDFGAHVCGNFKIKHDDFSYHAEGTLHIHRKLTKMLESPPEPNEKPWYNLARSFYKKCLDTTSDVDPDWRAMYDQIGGWPVLTANWTEFKSFEEYIANFHRKFDVDFLLKTSVSSYNIGTTTKNVIYVKPSLALADLSYFFYLSERKYGHKTERFGIMLFYEFYSALYNMTSTSRPIIGTVALFKKKFPHFDFETYFKHLYDGIAPFDLANTTVVLESPAYFKIIRKLLKPDKKRRVANYAGALVFSHLSRLPKTEFGCVYFMYDKFLSYPVAQMYVKNYLDRDAVQKVTEMVKLIKEELRESLETASWLDEKTRANALLKMDKMADSVGYPENLFNDTYFEKNWNIPPSPSSESFYELVARIERKRIASSLLKITEPIDTVTWDEPIIKVNAYYDLKTNNFAIQSGYLQLPFYSSKLPDYINYAVTGATIGHEMMHGFDNRGRLRDAFGKVTDWWDNATSAKYMEKANCYVKQYTAEGVDGMATLGENIADNVGFKLAYGAYKRLLKKLGVSSEPALPTFEKLSLEQMFFIASSHGWCNNGQVKQYDKNDPHPPADTRVKMIARNSKQFGKAFNCKRTAPMNPDEKCSIW